MSQKSAVMRCRCGGDLLAAMKRRHMLVGRGCVLARSRRFARTWLCSFGWEAFEGEQDVESLQWRVSPVNGRPQGISSRLRALPHVAKDKPIKDWSLRDP